MITFPNLHIGWAPSIEIVVTLWHHLTGAGPAKDMTARNRLMKKIFLFESALEASIGINTLGGYPY